MTRHLTREFFERQAAELGKANALRREIHRRERSLYKRSIRRMAYRAAKNSEVDLFSRHEKSLMKALKKEKLSIEEIAQKFGTDCLTVVLILEGVA